MTYTPLWPDWAATTQRIIDDFMVGLDDEGRAAIGGVADFVGEQLRSEFPDLDKAIVGWVAMRVCSHLGALATKGPVTPHVLALVGVLAGQSIEAGEV